MFGKPQRAIISARTTAAGAPIKAPEKWRKEHEGEKFTKVVLIEAAAAEIIRKNGGWREQDILGKASRSSYGECYFEIGDTWTDEHKIIRVVQSKRTEEGKWITGNFCEVDILTGKITG